MTEEVIDAVAKQSGNWRDFEKNIRKINDYVNAGGNSSDELWKNLLKIEDDVRQPAMVGEWNNEEVEEEKPTLLETIESGYNEFVLSLVISGTAEYKGCTVANPQYMTCGLTIPATIQGQDFIEAHRQHHIHKHTLDPLGSGLYGISHGSCQVSCLRMHMYDGCTFDTLIVEGRKECSLVEFTELICRYDCGYIVPRFRTTTQHNHMIEQHTKHHQAGRGRKAYWFTYIDVDNESDIPVVKAAPPRKVIL